VLTYLLDHAPGYDAVIARWPNDYIEPLQAVYRTTSAARSATTTLREGQLRMRDMIRRLARPRYISTDTLRAIDPRLDTYHNVNTPDDLRTLETRFQL
jgi:molybdopterin-guanine dinucleotide biosynthesis protein A